MLLQETRRGVCSSKQCFKSLAKIEYQLEKKFFSIRQQNLTLLNHNQIRKSAN